MTRRAFPTVTCRRTQGPLGSVRALAARICIIAVVHGAVAPVFAEPVHSARAKDPAGWVTPLLRGSRGTNASPGSLEACQARAAAAPRPLTVQGAAATGPSTVRASSAGHRTGTPKTSVIARAELPLAFIENRGQIGGAARFYARTGRQAFWMTATGIVVELVKKETAAADRLVFTQRLVGARPDVAIEGEDLQGGTHNYLIGDDPARWRTGVRSYGEVIYRDVYDGIDLELLGAGKNIEQQFIVRPGARPSTIQVTYSGIDSLQLDSDGSLIVRTRFGALRETAPRAYQTIGRRTTAVDAQFTLLDERTYTFTVGSYDPASTLVIDPTLIYSTYLGGGAEDNGTAIALDGRGNAYAVGYTSSFDFPTETPFQPDRGGAGPFGSFDAFVSKLDPSGTGLVYSTYLAAPAKMKRTASPLTAPGMPSSPASPTRPIFLG